MRKHHDVTLWWRRHTRH